MEAVILSKEAYQELQTKVNEIHLKLCSDIHPAQETLIDNNKFLDMMSISKRTAQTWRDEGMIAFSQIGAKIYYQQKDIDLFLQSHYIKSLKHSK